MKDILWTNSCFLSWAAPSHFFGSFGCSFGARQNLSVKGERQGRQCISLCFFISQPLSLSFSSLSLSLSESDSLTTHVRSARHTRLFPQDSRYSMVQSRAFATQRSPTCHFAWVGPRRHERLMGPKPRSNESRNSLPDKSKKKPSTATSWCMFCRYTYWILLALDQF